MTNEQSNTLNNSTIDKTSNKRIYLSPPHMGGTELKHIHNAFDTNWIAPVGPHINEFEDQLAAFAGMEHAAVLSSGTAALHLALKLVGVTSGDSVICQSFTFAGSAFPINYLGAKPVFIDSERETWNMDPNYLEDYLKSSNTSKHQLPKAIIPVHLYGMPAKMDEINQIALKYDIQVIEDAAEALGSVYKNRCCGSLGNMSVLSFNGNKIITTSGGGALLSNSKEEIDKAKFLATQARDDAPHYEHSEVGYNYRMGNINAAIGLGQMEVLESRVSRKREIFDFYKKELAEIATISFQPEPEGFSSNRWLTTILTDSYEHREAIRAALELENIESRPLWKPMHMQAVFNDAEYIGGKVAEDLFEKGLCLPSGGALPEDDLFRVVEIIKKESSR